jgi:hypothetical protein
MAAVATVAVMIAVLLDQGYGFFLRSDAETFYRVALDPSATGASLRGAVQTLALRIDTVAFFFRSPLGALHLGNRHSFVSRYLSSTSAPSCSSRL